MKKLALVMCIVAVSVSFGNDKMLEAGIIGAFNGFMMMIIISLALWIWKMIKKQ